MADLREQPDRAVPTFGLPYEHCVASSYLPVSEASKCSKTTRLHEVGTRAYIWSCCSNGDPVRIEAHVAPSGTKAKVKKKVGDGEDGAAVEGVVYKVS